MPLPKPRKNVDRDLVHEIVQAMLQNPNVGDVACTEQADRRYTIVPRASRSKSVGDHDES